MSIAGQDGSISTDELDEQIEREALERKLREFKAEQEYRQALIDRGDGGYANAGAYDPERTPREPDADPTTPEGWEALMQPDVTVGRKADKKSRLRRDPRPPNADELNERHDEETRYRELHR